LVHANHDSVKEIPVVLFALIVHVFSVVTSPYNLQFVFTAEVNVAIIVNQFVVDGISNDQEIGCTLEPI
jgi:hypothetical protein